MAFNWQNWTKRLSTLVAALTATAGSVLAYYASLPPMERAGWPWWVPLALTVLVPLLPALIPVATSYKQQSLAPDDTDAAGA